MIKIKVKKGGSREKTTISTTTEKTETSTSTD